MKKKILLDNNIWRYVVDANLGKKLFYESRNANITILACPAVVEEVLNNNDTIIRDKMVKLIARNWWERMMPEAFTLAQELLKEIERLHPDWIRFNPDTKNYNRSFKDWQKDYWERIVKNTELMARLTHHDYISAAADRMQLDRVSDKKTRVTDVLSSRSSHLGAELIDPRRYRLKRIAENWIINPGPFEEWLLPFIISGVEITAEWEDFWYRKVNPVAIKTWWLLGTAIMMQRFVKVNRGSPVDIQITSYLTQADIFISSDRRLMGVVKECSSKLPFRIAVGKLMPGNVEGAHKLIEWMEAGAKV